MAGIFGIIAVALGVCLLWLWWPAVLSALKAILVLSLVFWGTVALLVQHAKNKARLDRERARRDLGASSSLDHASGISSSPESPEGSAREPKEPLRS